MRVYCVNEGHSKSRQYLLNILQKQNTTSPTLKTQRIILKLLSMSRFIRSFSKRGSWWTSWQSCPKILMLQGKIRWFTALLRRALGSTVMIPCFQLPPNQWWVYWCDSDWFRLFSHQQILFGIQDATKHACSILHLQSPNVTMTCRVPSLQS